MTGKIDSRPELKRFTPYHEAHSTALAGLTNISGGDNRFYNNIFVGGTDTGADAHGFDRRNPERFLGFGLWVYDTRKRPLQTGGNVYFADARPYTKEVSPLVLSNVDPKPRLVEEGQRVFLQFNLPPEWKQADPKLVTGALLGKAAVSQLPFEQADGSPLTIGTDYLGRKRSDTKPSPGPFENPSEGALRLRVW
jgi:hypothetical protein